MLLGIGVTLNHYVFAATISVLSGLVFMLFAYRTACAIGTRTSERIFALLAILSTGTIMLFFGYVEAYPPVAAWVMVCIYTGIRYIQGRSRTVTVVFVFTVAVFLHLSLVVLLPGLAAILIYRRRDLPTRRRLLLLLGITTAAVLIFLTLVQSRDALSGFFRHTFLPIAPGAGGHNTAYHVFSPKHFFDIVNELLLICPIAIFIFVVFKRPGDEGDSDGSESKILLFLETIVVFYILELLVFNKILGASRDWDLFSPLAIPLALLTALVVLQRFRTIPRILAVLAAAVLVIHTIPWVAVNTSKGRSVDRFTNLADRGYWSNYAKAYAYSLLGIHFENTGDTDKSIEYASEASRYDPNPRYKFKRASLLLQNNRADDAARLFEELVRRDPSYVEARQRLGTAYLRLGRAAEAKKQFRAVVELDPSALAAHNYLGLICFKERRYNESIAAYSKAIEIDPNDHIPYKNIGIAYSELGRNDKAIEFFSKAIERKRDSGDLYRLCAAAKRKRDDTAGAAASLAEGIRNVPEDMNLRFELALALDELGRYDEALVQLNRILTKHRDPRVINSIGVIYTKQGKTTEAIDMFDKAASIDSTQTVYRINLARACRAAGLNERARQLVLELKEMNHEIPADLLKEPSGD